MTRDEALQLLGSGPEGIAEWNRRRADLRGADLRGADLRGADLRKADLGGGIYLYDVR